MISIKTVSEKYETFCGEKLSRFFLKYVVIMMLLFTSFNFNRNVEQSGYFITRGIIIFLVQFLNVGKSVYKVIKKDQKDLEEKRIIAENKGKEFIFQICYYYFRFII